MRALSLSIAGAVVLALAFAAALDAMGDGTVAFGPLSCAAAAALGALQAMLWPALLSNRGRTGRTGRTGRIGQRAAVGGLLAGTAAFVLGRAPLGWLDLGALGAGSPGELQLVLLPVVSMFAVVAVWPTALENTAARRARRAERRAP
jgi:Na+/proline symporter